jgi:hypothetical protein
MKTDNTDNMAEPIDLDEFFWALKKRTEYERGEGPKPEHSKWQDIFDTAPAGGLKKLKVGGPFPF